MKSDEVFNHEIPPILEPTLNLRLVRPKGTYVPSEATNKLQQRYLCKRTGKEEWRDVAIIYV